MNKKKIYSLQILIFIAFVFITLEYLQSFLSSLFQNIRFLQSILSYGDIFLLFVVILVPAIEEAYKLLFVKMNNELTKTDKMRYYVFIGIIFQYLEILIIGINNVFLRMLMPLHWFFQLMSYHIVYLDKMRYKFIIGFFLHAIFNLSVYYKFQLYVIIIYYLILLIMIYPILHNLRLNRQLSQH